VTGEHFINDVISAIRSGKGQAIEELREKYRTTDYLLIDDIDFLLGKETSMCEMAFIIKDTVLKDKMVVVSSHKDFTSDTNCDEDFRAVFCGWTKVEMRRE
jgi:chromosomal replication initiator protein